MTDSSHAAGNGAITNANVALSGATSNTSVALSGAISNTSVAPFGATSNTNMALSGVTSNTNVALSGANSNTNLAPPGTNAITIVPSSVPALSDVAAPLTPPRPVQSLLPFGSPDPSPPGIGPLIAQSVTGHVYPYPDIAPPGVVLPAAAGGTGFPLPTPAHLFPPSGVPVNAMPLMPPMAANGLPTNVMYGNTPGMSATAGTMMMTRTPAYPAFSVHMMAAQRATQTLITQTMVAQTLTSQRFHVVPQPAFPYPTPLPVPYAYASSNQLSASVSCHQLNAIEPSQAGSQSTLKTLNTGGPNYNTRQLFDGI